MPICLQYSTKQSLSHLVSLSKLSVANLQMSTQVPFLICQQYVLRCPLLMGEDSNKMGFCEAKMSFSHTNEAGLTGLEVSSRDSKPKDAMDVPVLYQRSHCSTRALEEISASSSLLIYHSLSSTVQPGRAKGMGTEQEQRTPPGSWFYILTTRNSEANPAGQK